MYNYPRLTCPLLLLALTERLNDVNSMRQRSMINTDETREQIKPLQMDAFGLKLI